ncbi:MAG: hypothetical protein NZM37_01835 [Sandaracinaceae bacterium]|nr:hypothetical protein [Sandaracinaceae bacterium]
MKSMPPRWLRPSVIASMFLEVQGSTKVSLGMGGGLVWPFHSLPAQGVNDDKKDEIAEQSFARPDEG